MEHLAIPDLRLAAQIAEGAARAAGAMIRRAFDQPRNVSDKGVNDLVTATDVASERLLTHMMHTAFPNWRVAGEEGARLAPTHDEGDNPLTWWIDPLDGTTNFVHSIPRFGVSLGAVDPQGNVLVGVVYDPMRDDCFCAVRGDGATYNGAPIHVSSTAQLRGALAASGFPGDLRTTNNNTAEWAAFVSRCQGMARMGSAALDLSYVACGRFDVYWEYGLATWDMCAGVLIAQEAGGQVTDYAGQPFNVLKRGGLLATNGLLHAEALDVLNAVRKSD